MRHMLFAAACAASLTSAANAVVFNENFNSTAFRGSFLQDDVTDRFGPSTLYYAQDAAGWTFVNGSAGFPYVLIATTPDGADGDLWLQEIGSSASHDLTGLVAGRTYDVSFLQSGDNDEGASYAYTVEVDGTQIYLGSGTDQAPGTNPGTPITTSFVATGPTATLRFADADSDTGPNVVIDNILVTAVPDAAAWALMIAGFGLVGSVARRRRTMLAA